MKENEFEPAKIIEKPGEKKKQQSEPPISAATVAESSVVSETTEAQSGAKGNSREESFEGILGRFTGKNKGQVVWAIPYDMHQNGSFDGLHGATVDRMARDITGIVVATIFHAYLVIGYYLLAAFFDSDESLVFSKNPYKETSLNDLARRDDIPFTRQKLTECIKAASVDMELRKHGHHLEHLHYEHLNQIARLKKQGLRLEKAQEANDKKLTSNELKKDIDNLLGKRTSQDKQIAHALARQLRDFVRLTSDEDVLGFLEDKERSAVLEPTEIAELLEFSGKFREAAGDSEEMLKQLESNLRDNFMEKQQKDQDSGKALLTS